MRAEILNDKTLYHSSPHLRGISFLEAKCAFKTKLVTYFRSKAFQIGPVGHIFLNDRDKYSVTAMCAIKITETHSSPFGDLPTSPMALLPVVTRYYKHVHAVGGDEHEWREGVTTLSSGTLVWSASGVRELLHSPRAHWCGVCTFNKGEGTTLIKGTDAIGYTDRPARVPPACRQTPTLAPRVQRHFTIRVRVFGDKPTENPKPHVPVCPEAFHHPSECPVITLLEIQNLLYR
ncbi:hypothetical protein J6590_043333 [Homalodisca vitripennis]|nr:hypothetical protein J6590_043333 [Homalodisca vitripennis]